MSAECKYCGRIHPDRQCERIEEIEYYNDGKVKRVKLFAPRDTPSPGEET